MIPRITPEQNLEKRSVPGGYVCVFAWLIIGVLTDYYSEHPKTYSLAMLLLILFAISRVWTNNIAEKQQDYARVSWQWLLIINAIGPALVYGMLFATAMLHPEHQKLFLYLFMVNIALLSGATITYSPNQILAIYYLTAITIPPLSVALMVPQSRDTEAAMLCLYMFFNIHMIKLLNQEFNERISQKKTLEELAQRDSLTGLFNRRYFDHTIPLFWAKNLTAQSAISMLILDIDNFKQINDTYGHPIGDEVIRKVADTIEKNFQREVDLIARFGGEEFAILVQESSFEQTRDLARSICQQIASYTIETEKGPAKVTVSIGLAHAIPCSDFDQEDIYKLADDCLYQAKNQGKNRVFSKSVQP